MKLVLRNCFVTVPKVNNWVNFDDVTRHVTSINEFAQIDRLTILLCQGQVWQIRKQQQQQQQQQLQQQKQQQSKCEK